MSYNDCRREWGICPDSMDEGEPGEPHQCFYMLGHGHDHTCGTCEATIPLDDNETSSLEEPLRGQ